MAEREEKILASLLNYWTVHSGSGSFAYSNIYTDSILPPVLLSPSGLPRQVGRKDGCAREDVSSRGSRGVNYFTILFEEARAWNLRNEIPRRLAETWLIFYRRPVYIYIYVYIVIRSLLRPASSFVPRKFHFPNLAGLCIVWWINKCINDKIKSLKKEREQRTVARGDGKELKTFLSRNSGLHARL